MPWAETERKALAETLSETEPDAPTLCAGWDARHVLAHLVQREHSPARSLGDVIVKRQPGEEKYLGKLVEGARTPAGYHALVNRFLAGPARWSPMSWAGDNLNLVEFVIHHEDVRRGSGTATPRVLPADESRAIWGRLGLFGRLSFRRSPVGVTLMLPGGASQVAQKGADGVVVTAEPVELALYVSGRRQAATVDVSGAPGRVASFESWLASS